MPAYDFGCTNDQCQHVFEGVFSIKDAPSVTACARCGADAKRLISAPSVFSDEPKWIDGSLRNHIQDDGERPITTRKELADYCKEKKISPCS